MATQTPCSRTCKLCRDACCARAQTLIWVGSKLPQVSYAAAFSLLMFSLALVFGQPGCVRKQLQVCPICLGKPLRGLRSFCGLLLGLSILMPMLKHQILPKVIPPDQFEQGVCLGKYYGFGAQILYHCILATCFFASAWKQLPGLYHMATLAEPAYCTLDVMMLIGTGTSFTHWQAGVLSMCRRSLCWY